MQFSPINLLERPHLAACAHGVHYGSGRFRLANHWSTHIYHYHARLRIGEADFEVHPGALTLVPPGTLTQYQFQGPSHHVYAHFTLPETTGVSSGLSVPVFYDMRADFVRFEAMMETMAQSLLLNRLRAEIKLWDLLWELARCGQNTAPHRHPSLEKALSLIELRLGEPIAVTALAREVGLSHNHLTRLFQHELGTTVVAYVRKQRAGRARHLLENTTMPLKAIAAQVNAADYQRFSALMKKETGHPPSHWRRGGEK